MRYLLVVGFTCEVYRREPRARIFVGDRLVDEYYISHETDRLTIERKKFIENHHALQPIPRNTIPERELKNFPDLKFYEVEVEQNLDQIEIKIEIGNNDNNYLNGFMTHSTFVKLQVCYFFPLHDKLIARLIKIKNRTLPTKKYAWNHLNKMKMFNLKVGTMSWQPKNGKFVPTTMFDELKIGGDGAFSCVVYKKYGFFFTKMTRPCKFDLNHFHINYFLNKYQHANQRNNS